MSNLTLICALKGSGEPSSLYIGDMNSTTLPPLKPRNSNQSSTKMYSGGGLNHHNQNNHNTHHHHRHQHNQNNHHYTSSTANLNLMIASSNVRNGGAVGHISSSSGGGGNYGIQVQQLYDNSTTMPIASTNPETSNNKAACVSIFNQKSSISGTLNSNNNHINSVKSPSAESLMSSKSNNLKHHNIRLDLIFFFYKIIFHKIKC